MVPTLIFDAKTQKETGMLHNRKYTRHFFLVNSLSILCNYLFVNVLNKKSI